MRTFAAIALLGFLCACSSGKSTDTQSSTAPGTAASTGTSASATKLVLRQSSTTFSAAESACKGELGSVMFTLGHARAHAAPGVQMQTKESSPSGITTFTFSDKTSGKAATVVANGHDRSLSGKNITAKQNGAVGCVGAE